VSTSRILSPGSSIFHQYWRGRRIRDKMPLPKNARECTNDSGKYGNKQDVMPKLLVHMPKEAVTRGSSSIQGNELDRNSICSKQEVPKACTAQL
jgi:hypothetical protein